jgi:hypothetical protein
MANEPETTRLWNLGNTSIRNPERLVGAVKVFDEFFHGGKTFENNEKLEEKFGRTLTQYTDEGTKITEPNQIPIAEYSKKQTGKDIAKNGRQWLSLLEKYGFANVRNATKVFVDKKNIGKAILTDVGKIYSKHPELRNEIFLGQLLKSQFPHYKDILNGIKIRPGWWFLKLMIECDGLTKQEVGYVSLNRNEDFIKMRKFILNYRKKLKTTRSITDLDQKYEGELIGKWFKTDFEPRVVKITQIIEEAIQIPLEEHTETYFNKFGKDLRGFSCPKFAERNHKGPLGLGKGGQTKKAKRAACDMIQLLLEEEKNVEKYVEVFTKYYGVVKRGTIWSDYVDSNVRILKLTGIVNSVVIEGEDRSRYKISDDYLDIVTDAINNLSCIYEIEKNNDKDLREYYDYLVDIKKPEFNLYKEEYFENHVNKMENEIKQLGGKIPKFKTDKNIDDKRFKNNQLFIELKRKREENFIEKQNPKKIVKEIQEMVRNPKKINPTKLEDVIWRAISNLGGFKEHVSETRNFHINSKFESIFTAEAGPDMQFSYSKFTEIIEVTKMQSKDQFKGEFNRGDRKPVPEHVAEYSFFNGTNTNCIFIAPEIDESSLEDCFDYSCKNETFEVKGEKISFKIIPLTLLQFVTIYQKCVKEKEPATKWLTVISDLHKITKNTEKDWIDAIQLHIENL